MIFTLWYDAWPVIETVCGGVLGWYGKIAFLRARVRRDRLDAGQQALDLAAALTVREQAQATA